MLNQAPLVIGADGIRSAVRSKIVGDMTPRDNGRTMWRAVIDANLCHHPVNSGPSLYEFLLNEAKRMQRLMCPCVQS
jgi:2-polyprenyl-6-methoxyphenol hydroxylase-like FAD-dependent oxidoreductase